MIINKLVTQDNDLISTLKSWGFSPTLASYLYHHKYLIRVNDIQISHCNLKKGDLVSITLLEENKTYGNSSNSLDIKYEDDYLLIVNKPPNIATIPTIRHFDNNLSSDVTNYYIKNGVKSIIHIVNRLDYETSGLIIFAKHAYIHSLFRNIKIEKYYLLKVHGIILKNGIINKPIMKDPLNKKKRIISEKGKESITEYEIIRQDDNSTFLKAHLVTGRTHQLRLHFSSINHPIIGDSLYGKDEGINLELVCNELKFIHPITHSTIHIILNKNY